MQAGYHVRNIILCLFLDPESLIRRITLLLSLFLLKCPGGGVLPYMAYTGMCRWTGYDFMPLCPKQGMWFRAILS